MHLQLSTTRSRQQSAVIAAKARPHVLARTFSSLSDDLHTRADQLLARSMRPLTRRDWCDAGLRGEGAVVETFHVPEPDDIAARVRESRKRRAGERGVEHGHDLLFRLEVARRNHLGRFGADHVTVGPSTELVPPDVSNG